MALKRQKHWETRAYPAYLQTKANEPYAYGSNDCLMFAADGMLAICGESAGTANDPAKGFRGMYSDAIGAAVAMRAVTGSTDMLAAVTAIAARIGLVKRTVPLTAQRGDVVLVEDAERLICALVGLSGRYVHAPGEKGLRAIDITKVQYAWTY